MAHQPGGQAYVPGAVEAAIDLLLRRRRSFAVADARGRIAHHAQECRQVLVGIPARRNGVIEMPLAQHRPIEQKRGEQPPHASRQPRRPNIRQRQDFVNARIGREQRFVGSLHHHRAPRARLRRFQRPEERCGQDDISHRVQPEYDERRGVFARCAGDLRTRDVPAPEQGQPRGQTQPKTRAAGDRSGFTPRAPSP